MSAKVFPEQRSRPCQCERLDLHQIAAHKVLVLYSEGILWCGSRVAKTRPALAAAQRREINIAEILSIMFDVLSSQQHRHSLSMFEQVIETHREEIERSRCSSRSYLRGLFKWRLLDTKTTSSCQCEVFGVFCFSHKGAGG